MSNLSGNLVQDQVGAVCLDLDQTRGTGYTGTFSGSQSLTVSGNIKRKGTWSYTGQVTMNATTTGKTIQNNGVAWNNGQSLGINGSGLGVTALDAITGSPNLVLTAGAIDLSTFSHTFNQFQTSGAVTRSLAGSGSITCSASGTFWSATGSGFTSTFSGTITGPGGTATFAGGGFDYRPATLVMNNVGATQDISGANSLGALTYNVTSAVKTAILRLAADQTISGLLTVTGNSVVNRAFIGSNLPGTQRTITVTGPTAPTLSNANFQDINAAGGSPIAPWAGTSMGDCGGNNGITFDASTTQTWGPDASGSWSTAANWTSRVPLPQDTVAVSRAFTAGRVITLDMPYAGTDITFSCTGNPQLTVSVNAFMYGNLTLATGMSSGNGGSISMQKRGTATVRCNGVTPGFSINLGSGANMPVSLTTNISLQDALIFQGTATISGLNGNGTLTSNGFNIKTNSAVTAGNAGNVSLGATQWELAGIGTLFNWTSTAVPSAGTSVLRVTDTTASTKSVNMGGTGAAKTWYELYLVGSGGGTVTINGANVSYTNFRADSGRSILFTAGVTFTAANWFLDGCTIGSPTAANHTLAKSGGGKVKAQGVTVSRSTASPTFTFYAFNGATDGGNNVNWNFYNPDYTFALDPMTFSLSMPAQALYRNRKLVCESMIFSFTMCDVSLLYGRRLPMGSMAFSFDMQPMNLVPLNDDPRYTIRGAARNRTIGGSRNRTIYK